MSGENSSELSGHGSNFNYLILVLSQLGLVNEHQRPDRDDYIQVDPFAITDGYLPKFQKHSKWSPANEKYPFDIGSIMMFDSYDFTKE